MASPMTVADGSCACAAVMTDSPVLKESRGARDVSATIAILPPSTMPVVGRPRPIPFTFDAHAVDSRPTPPLVLRL
jgi:hypothetical protein